ncbi:hypothetical protein OHB07_00580 [Streptomyces sp. NBC_00111]|uniref:hypothetical protein n=1 Tax=unclassified Streptomyces TaxID=2593676 RepID=UPI002E37A9D8|nr:hypothetical protein [Streptomyces sp. NBC_01460]
MSRIAKTSRTSIVGLATAAAAAMTIVALPTSASATDITTPAGYEEYLNNQVEFGVDGASETLGDFQELSSSDQESFMDLLNDPQRGQELGDFLSDTAGGVIDEENFETQMTKETEGGDVVLTAEIDVKDNVAAPDPDDDLSDPSVTYKDKTITYSVYDKIFGVKVTRVTVGVNYRYSSSRVSKVYSGFASHKNFVPFSDFSHGVVSKWISANPANNAHAETVWQGTWAGFDWDARQRVWADQAGFKGGYLK